MAVATQGIVARLALLPLCHEEFESGSCSGSESDEVSPTSSWWSSSSSGSEEESVAETASAAASPTFIETESDAVEVLPVEVLPGDVLITKLPVAVAAPARSSAGEIADTTDTDEPSSRRSSLEAPSDTGARCREALRFGRLAEAARLQDLCDTSTAETSRHLMALYEKGRRVCSADPGDMAISERSESLKLRWGAEVSDGYIRIRHSWESSASLVKVLSMRMEKDLQSVYDADLVEATPLGTRQPAHGMWRIRTHAKSTGSKMDEVFSNFCVDALDEPARSVFLLAFALPPGTLQHDGVEIPGPMEGHERSPAFFSFTCGSPTATGGSRWSSYVEYKMAPLLYKVLSVMPTFVLKKIIRKRHEKEFSTLSKYFQDSPALDERLLTSPSAPLYHQLQKQLQESSP